MTGWREVVAAVARVWVACGIAIAVLTLVAALLFAFWVFPWWFSALLLFMLLLPVACHFAEWP